jgi:hypothetical protein
MAGDELKVSEIAVLLALMAEAREVSNVELKEHYGFTLTGESKARLNRMKLVASRKVGRAFAHELTDPGWARCRDELAAPCPPRAGTAGGALYALLHGLERYLKANQLSLSDVFRQAPEKPSVPSADVEAGIRAAYARARRQPAGWVSLTDLRPLLAAWPRDAIDAALTRMDGTSGVRVLPEENQRVLTPADREAAVMVGGRAYHFLLIEGA